MKLDKRHRVVDIQPRHRETTPRRRPIEVTDKRWACCVDTPRGGPDQQRRHRTPTARSDRSALRYAWIPLPSPSSLPEDMRVAARRPNAWIGVLEVNGRDGRIKLQSMERYRKTIDPINWIHRRHAAWIPNEPRRHRGSHHGSSHRESGG